MQDWRFKAERIRVAALLQCNATGTKTTFTNFRVPSYTRFSAKLAAKESMSTDLRIRGLLAPALALTIAYSIEPMDNPFMARAIQLSLNNVQSGRGGPFGAVVVKDGNIVAEAANLVTATNDPTAHAEVLAIREACKKLRVFDLEGCEIYSSCEPCPMCLGAIYWARLARVYFANAAADASKVGFDDSLIYREIAQPHSQRQIPMIQMMRKQALAAFRAWENKPNKIEY
jgi:guanine deaminase